MAKNKLRKGKVDKKVLGGIAAGAAVAGAGYYLLGPKGKKHRKQIKKWSKTEGKKLVKEAKKMAANTKIEVVTQKKRKSK